MNDIAARFRPKLNTDWPKPLDGIFNAALAEDAHDPEYMVGQILETWSKDDAVDKAIREALECDAFPLMLNLNHGKEWGETYFGPMGSFKAENGDVITYPRRERLTQSAIEHWRDRANHMESHVGCARYSDAAWDLAPLVELPRCPEDALRAIDSYLGQCASSRSELHLERCLQRAHCLARAIGDTNRMTKVRTSLFELCHREESEACKRMRFLACDLYLYDQKSAATDAEKATIVEWMEKRA